MSDIPPLFEKLNSISKLSKGSFEALNSCFEPKSFPKGSNLLVPGEIQKELYFIQKGVQMAFFENSQKLHVMAFTYPPDFCAIPDSFLLQKPSKYSLTCLSDSEVLALSHKDLQGLFLEYRDIETLFRKMTELILAGVLDRQLEMQSENMQERFRSFCARSPHLLQLAPQKYLASYLGIDPTNFSKLINSIKI
jgi:CRP-like cAMP-binding protein